MTSSDPASASSTGAVISSSPPRGWLIRGRKVPGNSRARAGLVTNQVIMASVAALGNRCLTTPLPRSAACSAPSIQEESKLVMSAS